ncbi:hypothetical protein GCM10018781_29360 [Kitasatospora indigofera]|uniref:DUF4304 domain-containing protein n=1 Tax=Kitasatospora indigofera TaxID=67307 RepID=A0A919KR39_9ACTN|nr:hypothetical protein [Kitasatospora indigofera]GHH70045.1 hypothetical protein GCM10018781_29360 [Kitasatospora indigofera]
MKTAQELYTDGLRDHFAPAMRALGLTGWRHTFSLPDEGHWALIGVVRRPLGDRVRFTLELSLTGKQDWADSGLPGLRPDPRVRYGVETWRARIGELLPVQDEMWWEVLPGPRWQVAVEDAVAAVRHYALPELLRLVDRHRTGETYLSRAGLADVNAVLLSASVARIQRAELTDKTLVLTGAWSRSDPVAREVLQGVAEGFLSAGDERFRAVRCADTLGRELWVFPGR